MIAKGLSEPEVERLTRIPRKLLVRLENGDGET
jgi:hypothetical protein